MPLFDHFRPPLSIRRHWHSFHNSWATDLAADLNKRLPTNYLAEANVRFGIEIDIATYDETSLSGGVAAPGWTPPAPTLTIPYADTTEHVEVLIYQQADGPRLAGAIELVSPSNVDRQTARDAFISKCVAYLSLPVGLLMVDVVTDRHTNLHAELISRLGSPDTTASPGLYATAYRRAERETGSSVDIWVKRLTLGQELPTLPLWLPGGLCLEVALEESYSRTCLEQRVITHGA
ncbi:MAG: DUF4058 domain-containing protein [Planctomycetes bacterium]|nr:DUF4058 domain-containing protein [Planctomycetota bacterium]